MTGLVSRLAILAIVAGAAFAAPSEAVNTCGIFLSIDYVGGPSFALPGDVVRVRLTFGAGSIQNGTKAIISRVRFALDCSSDHPLGIGCTDDGTVSAYQGDATITNTCGVNSRPVIRGAPRPTRWC